MMLAVLFIFKEMEIVIMFFGGEGKVHRLKRCFDLVHDPWAELTNVGVDIRTWSGE